MDMNMYFNYSLIIAVVSLFSLLFLAIGVAVLLTVVWRINRADKKEEEKAKAEQAKLDQALAEQAKAEQSKTENAPNHDGEADTKTEPAEQAAASPEADDDNQTTTDD